MSKRSIAEADLSEIVKVDKRQKTHHFESDLISGLKTDIQHQGEELFRLHTKVDEVLTLLKELMITSIQAPLVNPDKTINFKPNSSLWRTLQP